MRASGGNSKYTTFANKAWGTMRLIHSGSVVSKWQLLTRNVLLVANVTVHSGEIAGRETS